MCKLVLIYYNKIILNKSIKINLKLKKSVAIYLKKMLTFIHLILIKFGL